MMRNFSQTLINVLGLAVGMTCALLIFLWVHNQLSYDQSQEKKDRIYRLEAEWVILPPYLGDLIDKLPEVEDLTRLYFWSVPTVTYNENSFSINNFAYVDSTTFNIFNFDFLNGSPENALVNPFSLVLTKSVSDNLFKDENPIGKVVYINNKRPYTVTAVVDDIKNLHMEINAFAAVQDIAKLRGNNRFLESRNNNFLIYLLLKKGVNKEAFEDKLRSSDFNNTDDEFESHFLLRPFNEIYFATGFNDERFVKHGNYNLVLVFSAISVLILLIACINFINITTAKAQQREKEIGMRKIAGAGRKRLIVQFLGETLILVLLAHIISIVLLEYLLPQFCLITGETIHFNYLSPAFLIIVITIIITTTFISGFYPSLYLSSVKPVLILKGKSGGSTKGSLRKILMTIQFSISIFLIISTLVIVKQLNFVLNKDLGWNQKNIITFKLRGDKFNGEQEFVENSKDAFINEMLSNKDIEHVTFLNQLPGSISNTWTWSLNGEEYPLKIINSDPEFIKALDIPIIDGRNFSWENESDKDRKAIINEAAVKYLRLENPIGSIVNDGSFEIIGVVKDFNFNSLHNTVEPMGIIYNYWTSVACIKFNSTNITQTVKYIENVFHEFCPNVPFDYSFMDDTLTKQYKQEIRLSKLLISFAFVAIFIASLGLFGMSAFMGTTRRKEIGIRKALGSSTSEIMYLFSSSFVKWILISFLIASPFAYYVLKDWLTQYPYQTNISWWVFVVALFITLFIALVTIGYQVLKSARTNPVDCLRYE